MMTPSSGTAFLIARAARQTRLSGLTASEPTGSRRAGSVYGKSATAGMPSFAARSAARTASSSERRSTPGIEAIPCRTRSPSIRNSGQIRSSTVRVVSRTRRRDQSARRLRRIRRPPRIASMSGSVVRSAEKRERSLVMPNLPSTIGADHITFVEARGESQMIAARDEITTVAPQPDRYQIALFYYEIVLALLMMALGLRQWAVIVGLTAGTFEAMPVVVKIATMYLAVADLAAAVGL